MSQEQALVAEGRGHVVVAYRQQVPIARVAIWHDDGGLALATDLVVHPLHRGGGVASRIVEAAVTAHRSAGHPDDDVLGVGGSAATAGWERTATIVEVTA
jgi:GNAT superfamily N-acetyltransferase